MKLCISVFFMSYLFGNPLPLCIQHMESDFCSRSCVGQAKVYIYKHKKVLYYVLHPGNCKSDVIEEVYNAKGKPLGLLGGITGNYHIQNLDFSKLKPIDSVLWCTTTHY